jgi:sterol desaturase/sphingolipid hydroxylase (fatty acid hydroxylase superfamily)
MVLAVVVSVIMVVVVIVVVVKVMMLMVLVVILTVIAVFLSISDVYSYLNLYINPNTNRTILIGHIFNDIMFYLSHRMLHSKPLYW